jgi:hypothetical protein
MANNDNINSTDILDSAPEPPIICPEPGCIAPMKLKTARRGKHRGEQFWGCERFPYCRGIAPIEHNIVIGNNVAKESNAPGRDGYESEPVEDELETEIQPDYISVEEAYPEMFSGPKSLSEVILKMDSCIIDENLPNKDWSSALIDMRGLPPLERNKRLSSISKKSGPNSEILINVLRKASKIGDQAEYLPGVKELREQIAEDIKFLSGNFNTNRDPYKYT